MPESDFRSRHEGMDRDAFDQTARDVMNVAVETAGHHPHEGYTPSAWRHYTRRLALLDRLNSLQFQSALDVGCAEGFFMAEIGKASGAEMWGVDLSDRAVSVAASRYGFPVAAADATALPFADGAFDLVYSTEVIEHVLDPEAMLAELRRVSRGHVLVTTPVSQSEREHEPDYENRIEGHVNDFDEAGMHRLFGPGADIRTFRCNTTFALLTAFGRKLPPGPRDLFYRLDHRVAQRYGSPHAKFIPLRNRDWLIVTNGSAQQDGPREWRCPQCHGAVSHDDDTLRCTSEGLRFQFAAPGVPDFIKLAAS